MRSVRWVLAAGFLMLCAGLVHADGINPPDGNVGVKGGSNSVSITSLTFPMNFIPCSDPSVAADCALFGTGVNAPQEVFAAINDTGIPWTSLQIELTLPTWDAGNVLGCDGGTFFTINNCPQISTTLVASTSPQTVTIDFVQGGGNGIGCYDFNPNSNPSVASAANQGCQSISQTNFNNGSPTGPYDNPLDTSCGGKPDEVCGNSDFVIALGYNQDTYPSLPVGDGGMANIVTPEPSALILFGTGLLGLAGFARKKLLKS